MLFSITRSSCCCLSLLLLICSSLFSAICILTSRFNRFDFPPIFHRDEDTNPDELLVCIFLHCYSSLLFDLFVIFVSRFSISKLNSLRPSFMVSKWETSWICLNFNLFYLHLFGCFKLLAICSLVSSRFFTGKQIC